MNDIEKTKILENKIKELKKANLLLRQQILKDGLTGLFNKEYIIKRLNSELQRSSRYNETISFIMADIDYFKSINDTYGHLTGDAILKSVAENISRSVRNVDIVGRFGGEEFLIICPNTNVDGTKILAERIRRNVASTYKAYNNNINLTISLGISSIAPSSKQKKLKVSTAIIEEADIALYMAKSKGRDRVEIYEKTYNNDKKIPDFIEVPEQNSDNITKYNNFNINTQ